MANVAQYLDGRKRDVRAAISRPVERERAIPRWFPRIGLHQMKIREGPKLRQRHDHSPALDATVWTRFRASEEDLGLAVSPQRRLPFQEPGAIQRDLLAPQGV